MSHRARIAWPVVIALAIFGIWVVFTPSTQIGLGFLYALPVGLATWWYGWRAGAVALGGCLGLIVLGAIVRTVDDVALVFLARAGVLTGAYVLVGLLRQQTMAVRASAGELEALRAVLTPAALPEIPGVDSAAAFLPSEHGVSGDFYLVTNGPDGSTVAVVGDVVGHGVDAARLATFVRASLATFAANTSDPAQVLMLANQALVERDGTGSQYATAVCVRVDPARTSVSWAIAGHPQPLRLPSLEVMDGGSHGLPLGVQADLELTTTTAALRDGEGVLAYTDGAIEIRRQGRLLGTDGLRELLAPVADLRPAELVVAAQRAILDYADERLRDDLCLFVLRPQPRG